MRYLLILLLFNSCFASDLYSRRKFGDIEVTYASSISEGRRIVSCSVEGGGSELAHDMQIKRWKLYSHFRKDMETRNCGGACNLERYENGTVVNYSPSNHKGLIDGDCQVGTDSGFYWFITENDKIYVLYTDINIPVQIIPLNY